jgi:hypothetical protein
VFEGAYHLNSEVLKAGDYQQPFVMTTRGPSVRRRWRSFNRDFLLSICPSNLIVQVNMPPPKNHKPISTDEIDKEKATR